MSPGRAAAPVPIRRSLVAATAGTTVAAVLVVAVPLGIVRVAAIEDDADRSLLDRATAVALALDDRLEAGEPVDAETIGARLLPGTHVVLELPNRRIEAGPDVASPRRSVTSPVLAGVRVTLTVDDSETADDVRTAVLVVAVVALGTIAIAVVAGLLLSRRLARPIEGLAAAATAAGHGDLAARVPRSGLREIDQVADALDTTLQLLARRLDNERRLSDKVAHQLRNSLTALRLQAEVAEMGATDDRQREALAAVIAQVDRFDGTIRDLTVAARVGPRATLEAATALVAERAAFWRPSFERDGRLLMVDGTIDGLAVDAGPARQALDVVVENGLRHGAGTLHLSTSERRGHVVIAVEDEGTGIVEGMEQAVFERGVTAGAAGGSGEGLALARDLLELHGGRLELARPRPARFELWLPAEPLGSPG